MDSLSQILLKILLQCCRIDESLKIRSYYAITMGFNFSFLLFSSPSAFIKMSMRKVPSDNCDVVRRNTQLLKIICMALSKGISIFKDPLEGNQIEKRLPSTGPNWIINEFQVYTIHSRSIMLFKNPEIFDHSLFQRSSNQLTNLSCKIPP